MASIFKRNGEGAYVIQYFDHQGRRREHSSRTTDFKAAQRIAAKLGADAALRREGVVDSRADSVAEHARTPLAEHVEAFAAHLTTRGRSEKHVERTKQLLSRSSTAWIMPYSSTAATSRRGATAAIA